MNDDELNELLRLNGRFLAHRESQRLEYKEQFNKAGLADYFRDFAAFANNKGGCLVFGVKDSPRLPQGLNAKSLAAFNSIDPERITGFLLDIFSSSINWEQHTVEAHGQTFGVFEVFESVHKPVIAKKDEGKDQLIKNGDIYFRYGGRTQKILSAELEQIISHRVEANNQAWIKRVGEIGSTGPQDAFVVGATADLSQTPNNAKLVIDEELAEKIKFVREGEFREKEGAETLKLVGDVVAVDKVEVERVVKEKLISSFPLTGTELWREVKKRLPHIKQAEVWNALNDLKGDPAYSAYNFRNKTHEERCADDKTMLNKVACIYNWAAVDLLVNVLSE